MSVLAVMSDWGARRGFGIGRKEYSAGREPDCAFEARLERWHQRLSSVAANGVDFAVGRSDHPGTELYGDELSAKWGGTPLRADTAPRSVSVAGILRAN